MLAVCGALTATTVSAQDDAEPAPPEYWYGWQTASLDVGSLTLWMTAGWRDAPALRVTGVLGLVLAAPIVHGAHGQWLRAGLSLLGRAAGVGLLMAAFSVVREDLACLGCHNRTGDPSAGLLVLGLIAIVVTPIVDALVAYDPIEPQRAHLSVRPWASLDRPAAGVALTLHGL